MSDAAAAETDQLLGLTGPLADLTTFQRDIHGVLVNDGDRKGLAIQANLEDYSGTEFHHGWLYPHPDDLVDGDYLAKEKTDERTNRYELTDVAQEPPADQQSCQRREGDT